MVIIPSRRNPIRVAFVDCLLGTGKEGGADVATRELAGRLAERGLFIRVFAYGQGIDLRMPSFLRTAPLVRELTAFPLAGKRAMRLAEAYGFHLVHLNSLPLASLYRSSLPVVVTLHNIQSQKFSRHGERGRLPLLYNPLVRAPFHFLENRSLTNVDRFLPVNRSMQEFLHREWCVPEERITRIPNGVDTALFRPSSRRNRRVIFVGRATPPKGFPDLLRAAPAIQAPILVVTTKMSRRAAARARGAGMEVRFDLSHAELAPEMAASTLLVLPSWDEEQPLVILEAMACGIPVVTTPEGASDLVEDGVNGLVVPAGNPRALAEAVNRLLEDPVLAASMGEAGRSLAEEKYAWDKVVERVMAVYDDLLAGRGR